MPESKSFFIGEEVEQFRRPGRFQTRYIIPTPLTPSAKKPTPEELTTSVLGRLRTLSNKPNQWFGCCCISVPPDDGMSWSAEALAQQVADEFASYDVLPLSRQSATDSLPHIVQVIGERSLMKAAVRQKLANWYPTLYVSHAPLIVAGIFVLGGLIAALQALVKLWAPSSPAQPNQVFDLKLFVLAGVLAILAIVAKLAADKLSTGKKKASIDEFIGKLPGYEASPRQGTAAYWKFVGEAAKSLEWVAKPRIVIVDNYERLDLTTRRILERYFQESYKDAAGAEFWVIFESTDGPGFSKLIQQSENGYAQFSKNVSFFQQQLLTQAALLKLNQFLGRDEVPQYSTVKSVVAGTAQQVERVVSAVKAFTSQHPRKEGEYDELEFFYFLSLAASPGSIEFSRNELSSLLSAKKLERSEVLRRLLAGTGLNKGQFQEDIAATARSFKDFVAYEERGADTIVGVSSEVARVLEEKADQLGLPDAALVHLYWALFWFDSSQPRPPDAYRLRKLGHHILRTEMRAVLNCALTPKFLSIVIYVIGASMRSCLFTSLLPFLEKAFNTYDSLEAPQRRKAEGGLAGLSWEVYSVSGDELALAHLCKLQEAEEVTASDAQEGNSELAEIFLGSTALDSESRNSLRRVFQGWLARESERKDVNQETAKRNSYARAGWLLSCFVDLSRWVGVTGTLVASVIADQQDLKLAFRKSCDRIYADTSALPMFTDVMTLSLCLWSSALLAKTLPDPVGMVDQADMAETALIIAERLKDRAMASEEMELLLFALVREVCAVALGCLLMVYHTLQASGLPPESNSKIYKLIQEGQSIFKSSASSSGWGTTFDFERAVNETDNLFAQCAFIWTRFDLERLRSFADLRRLQFNVVCRDLAPDDQVRLLPLMQAASPALDSVGYPGILGNCIAASCHLASAELCAHFVLQAADRAIDNELSRLQQIELAMLAIEKGHAFGFDLERYLRVILEPGTDGKTAMRRFLGVLDKASFPGFALSYLNAADGVADAALADQVLNTVREVSRLLPAGPERVEVESLLQYHTFKLGLSRDGKLPPAEQVVEQWKDRKHLWMYAGVLRMLIETGDPRKVRDEACAVLRRDPAKDGYSSFFQLAVTLGQHATAANLGQSERSVLFGYLRNAVRHWEPSVSADSNLAAYRVLASLDSTGRQTYLTGLMKWEKIKIERDHLKRLRELARNEKYLLIFRAYFDSAVFWGLKTDASDEEWMSFAKADFTERTEVVQRWVAEGAVVPQPIASNDGPLISARFLWIGQYLFWPPNDRNPAFEDHRTAFDQVAKSHLRDLLDGILQLPDMPPEVRSLLSHYSGGLLEAAGIRKRSVASRVA